MNTTLLEPVTTVERPLGPQDAPHLTLEEKVDRLTASVETLHDQLAFLTTKAHGDLQRQQEWDDLRTDLTPVFNDLYRITVQQLADMQNEVQVEDLVALVKRLLRSARSFNAMLDEMESLHDLIHDASPLTREIFDEVVTMLSDLERKGYFGFLRQSQYVVDQVVTSFNEEDVRQLGDNVVLILNTVKALTQPEMMNLINHMTQGFHEAEQTAAQLDISWLALARQMRDPDVRRGLALTMDILKRVSQQHQA